jgi:hypothetical protein
MQKWPAVGSYLKKVAPQLQEEFGRKRAYQPMQVKRIVEELGLSTAFLSHAMAIDCDRPNFDAYHFVIRKPCDYQELRTEIAQHFSHKKSSTNQNESSDGHIHIDSAKLGEGFADLMDSIGDALGNIDWGSLIDGFEIGLEIGGGLD